MSQTELDEIKSFWHKKYPRIDIRLWSNSSNDKYFGQILTASGNKMFESSTIGDLINQGENILRTL